MSIGSREITVTERPLKNLSFQHCLSLFSTDWAMRGFAVRCEALLAQLSIIENIFLSGRLSRSNKPLLEQRPNLSIFLPVDSIVDSRIYLLLLNYQSFVDEFGQRLFDGCCLMFDLLLDQPPFDDSFERVLSILMLNQMSQNTVFEL